MTNSDGLLGYKVMKLKFKADCTSHHMIFVKQHIVREKHPDKPSDRTLFLINVPPYCTKSSLKYAYRDCGPVTSVFLHSKPQASPSEPDDSPFFPTQENVKGFKVAYVVFETEAGLRKALKLNQTLILSSLEEPIICGLEKWNEEYNAHIPNVTLMQAEIDRYMQGYDKKVEQQIAKEKADGEEDDDGWITVTKRGRNPGFSRTEETNKVATMQENKKRSHKQLHNLYSFQIREAKMKKLMNLREKFEDDKKKIQMLKQSRKFKPF